MVQTRSQRKAEEVTNGNGNGSTSGNENGQDHQSSNETPEESKQVDSDATKSTKTVTSSASTAHDDPPETSMFAIMCSIMIAAVSYLTLPDSLQPVGRPSIKHVFYFGWISALSTGLGVLPLVFSPDLNSWWIGVTNAVASGMMVAASYSLIIEGWTFDEPDDRSSISSVARTVIGTVCGLLFILSTKSFLEKHEELTVGGLAGADARKVLLIIFVMTLHSFSEGVGIGVSFGGSNGSELGVFISASLAVHNVPEGLAVAIVLLPRKISKLSAALWCVVTSLPQPLMAVPAFLFVDTFIPFLPVGLGFAGGAMAWVAFCELLMEAIEDTNILTTGIISSMSLCAMLYMQEIIDGESRS